jgi:hypothetical protein
VKKRFEIPAFDIQNNKVIVKGLGSVVFLSTMEQRFELGNDEIDRVKQRLVSAIETEGRILFAYLHGSFGKLPFSDIDIGAYSTIPED